MPKLPNVSGRELTKALKKIGFKEISQKGPHIKLRHPDGRTAIVPNHRSLKPGTLKKGMLNPLRITVEELLKLLK